MSQSCKMVYSFMHWGYSLSLCFYWVNFPDKLKLCNSIAVPEKPKTWAALAASRAPSAQSNSAPATNSRPVRQVQQVGA